MDKNKLTRRNTISNIKTNPGKKNKPEIAVNKTQKGGKKELNL
tara:strand:- start:1164 stop:1292 length:129 start_codon:yes stop_codon:yes gene_type:complete